MSDFKECDVRPEYQCQPQIILDAFLVKITDPSFRIKSSNDSHFSQYQTAFSWINQRLYLSIKKENDLAPSEAQRVTNSVRYHTVLGSQSSSFVIITN